MNILEHIEVIPIKLLKTLLHMLLYNESNFPTFCKMRLNIMQLLEIVTEKARLTD